MRRKCLPSISEIKILAIGNSFSLDAIEYLYEILLDSGVENVTIGVLYRGGCSIEQHVKNAKNDTADYNYYRLNRTDEKVFIRNGL